MLRNKGTKVQIFKNIIWKIELRRMRWQEYFVYMRYFGNLYWMTAKPESTRKLGAPTGEQDNNIKININSLKPCVSFV